MRLRFIFLVVLMIVTFLVLRRAVPEWNDRTMKGHILVDPSQGGASNTTHLDVRRGYLPRHT